MRLWLYKMVLKRWIFCSVLVNTAVEIRTSFQTLFCWTRMSGLAVLAALRQHQRFAFVLVVMLTSTDDASELIHGC